MYYYLCNIKRRIKNNPELKIIQNKNNKIFINDVCNFLVLSNSNNSSKRLKTLLKKLLIDKNNLEILNICHKIFKII